VINRWRSLVKEKNDIAYFSSVGYYVYCVGEGSTVRILHPRTSKHLHSSQTAPWTFLAGEEMCTIFSIPKCPLRKIKDPTQGKDKCEAFPWKHWQRDKTSRTWMIHWLVTQDGQLSPSHDRTGLCHEHAHWYPDRGSLFSYMRRFSEMEDIVQSPIAATSSALSRWNFKGGKKPNQVQFGSKSSTYYFLRGSECNTKIQWGFCQRN